MRQAHSRWTKPNRITPGELWTQALVTGGIVLLVAYALASTLSVIARAWALVKCKGV